MPMPVFAAREQVTLTKPEDDMLQMAVFHLARDPLEFTTAFNASLSWEGEGRDPQECLDSFVLLWDRQFSQVSFVC